MAIVIDDIGNSLKECQELLTIQEPLTFAVMPGMPYSKTCTEAIHKQGQQVLIHFPWENLGGNYKRKYPIRIDAAMSTENMRAMFLKAKGSVPSANGINNHMGSQLSVRKGDLQTFMSLAVGLFPQGVYFLDSRTAARSKAYAVALASGIPAVKNDIFLDGKQTSAYIESQFKQAVKLAVVKGSVVVICHGNRPVTRRVLKKLIAQYNTQVDFGYLPDIIVYREIHKTKEGQK